MKLSEVREQFPQFAHTDEIPLDNAASTRKPKQVLEAVNAYYGLSCANVGRGSYRSARVAEEAVASCREQTKAFLSASAEDCVVFNRGATEGLNRLASCLGPESCGQGSNIVVTVAEHHSNLLPWIRLCNQSGAQLRIAKPQVIRDSKGNRQVIFRPEDVLRLVDVHTALISITACSNVSGSCLPIAQICQAVRGSGIPVIMDAAQLAAHKTINFAQWGCDALCFSAHKLYGPTGLGVICMKESLLQQLGEADLGGGAVQWVDPEAMTYGLYTDHHRLEAGTPPIGQILGFSAALSFLQALGMEHIAAYEQTLWKQTMESLSAIPGVRLIHGGQDSSPVISFTCDFLDSLDVGAMCDARHIAVRAGKHCAHPFLDFLGESATVRVSPCLYNTGEDIAALSGVLTALQRRFGP